MLFIPLSCSDYAWLRYDHSSADTINQYDVTKNSSDWRIGWHRQTVRITSCCSQLCCDTPSSFFSWDLSVEVPPKSPAKSKVSSVQEPKPEPVPAKKSQTYRPSRLIDFYLANEYQCKCYMLRALEYRVPSTIRIIRYTHSNHFKLDWRYCNRIVRSNQTLSRIKRLPRQLMRRKQ
jgi:hypothetical protein